LKLHNVQALRALAAAIVVSVHLYGIEAKYLLGHPWLSAFHISGSFGGDLFFVISGAIMVITTWRLARGAKTARDFLIRRITRIYPLYWIVTILILLLYLYSPGIVNPHSLHRPSVLASFLILPQRGEPLLLVGWTLVYEIFFYILFAVSMLLVRCALPLMISAWLCSVIVLALLTHGSSPWLRVAANPLNLEFGFGVAVGIATMCGHLRYERIVLLGAAVAIVAVFIYTAHLNVDYLDVTWWRPFAVGIPMALLLYSAIAFEQREHVVAPIALQRLGDASYSLYLWHVPILSVLGVVLHFTHRQGAWVHLSLIVVGYVACIAGALVLYRFIERPILRSLQRLHRSFVTHIRPIAASD